MYIQINMFKNNRTPISFFSLTDKITHFQISVVACDPTEKSRTNKEHKNNIIIINYHVHKAMTIRKDGICTLASIKITVCTYVTQEMMH
jgi:hypothetical protein